MKATFAAQDDYFEELEPVTERQRYPPFACDLVLHGTRQPPQAGLAVGHDGRKRLVDLMRDRRRQFSDSPTSAPTISTRP